jgi:DNA-binding YbaB/EbfC family protein
LIKGQIAGMMKQAQRMQEDMKKVQDELNTIFVEGQSSGGLVKVTVSCKHEVKNILIDDSLFSKEIEDKETLQDLLVLALNEAMKKAEKLSNEKMSSVTSGLPLPPGLKPF